MTNKVSNPKINSALAYALRNEVVYANKKAFIATLTFLRRVVRICRYQKYAYIPATLLKVPFNNQRVNYKECLLALTRQRIIEIDMQYIPGTKTRGYRLTEEGAAILGKTESDFLRTLLSNPKISRQIQKRASRRKAKRYDDVFLQHLHVSRLKYRFGVEAVNMINRSNWPHFTKVSASMSLKDFLNCDFIELKYNESDHRVCTDFVSMKSDLKRYFSIGKLKYMYVMDIRSCHPLFLAHYLVYHAMPKGYQCHNPMMAGDHQRTIVQNDSLKFRISSSTTNTTYTSNPHPTTQSPHIPSNPSHHPNPSNPIPHYVGVNPDILDELVAWNTIFSDPRTDPKTILIRELGYTRETAKAALNHSINGSRQYRKFLAWFKDKYPRLHNVWARTDSATVGNEISSRYETKLMQDMDLYRLAESLGLHLTYEYDGCGVMCGEDDEEVHAKIEQLISHVQARSMRLWGIRPILVVKTVEEPEAMPRRAVTGLKRGQAQRGRPSTQASATPQRSRHKPSR